MKRIEELKKLLAGLEADVRKATELGGWRFRQNAPGGEAPDVDDSGWEEKPFAPSWSLKDGPACFRRTIVPPAEIEGIPTAGSPAELAFVFPSGVAAHIDGTKVYEHRFWADRQATPLPFLDAVVPGERHLVVFTTPGGDGYGGFWAHLRIRSVEERLFDIRTAVWELLFAERIAAWEKSPALKAVLRKAAAALRPADIAARRWDRISDQIRRAEGILEEFRPLARRFRIHLVGHAHIDMNWLWTYDDTRHVCARDFETVLALMDENPDLTFSQSQSHVYRIVERDKPALFRRVLDRIREGRWDVTANAWVEGDFNMADGESIVRHLIFARRYARETLGAEPRVMWCPDTFGHPATVPSILADAGVPWYFHMRCGRKGTPLYRWRGPDGAEVLGFTQVYNNAIEADRILPGFFDFHERYGIADALFVYGVGDHGGGPTRADIARARKLAERPVFPRLEFSTTARFFEAMEPFRSELPVVEGEMNPIFEGCYTTHSDIKKANREGESILLSLEAIRAVAAGAGRSLPACDTAALWEPVLFNQFHDIFDGSAIHASYDYSNRIHAEMKERAEKAIDAAAAAIAGPPDGAAVAVNTLGWARDAVVAAPDGARLVRSIPPYGWTRLDAGADGGAPEPVRRLGGGVWETDFVTAHIDETTGLIRRLYDRRNRREVTIPNTAIPEGHAASWYAETAGNLASVSWEEPHSMSSWIIGNIRSVENLFTAEDISVSEGPLATVFTVRRRYRSSTIVQRTILHAAFPYVDFELDADWREPGNAADGVPLLRVSFTTALRAPEAVYETPFGSVGGRASAREWPALRWAALRDGRYWTGLVNRERYGHLVSGPTISLTILRNPYEPDSLPDSGVHRTAYRLLFGKLDETAFSRSGAELAAPPAVRPAAAAAEPSFSLLSVEGGVLPACLKQSEDGRGFVLRLVEMTGRPRTARVVFSRTPHRVSTINVTEEKETGILAVSDGAATIDMPASAIRTLRIEL